MAATPRAGPADTGATAHLDVALEHLPGGFTWIDRELRYVLVNSGYSRLFDYPPGLVAPGRPVIDELRFQAERGDFGERDVDAAIERILEGLRDPAERSYERHLTSGRSLRIRVAGTPDGGCVQIVTDITREKRLAGALAQKSATERRILDAIDEGVVMVDADMRIAAINHRFLEMFGLPESILDERPDFRELLRSWFRENDGDEDRLDKAIEYLGLRREATFDQSLPDGRVIAVQHLPQEEGVFLRTFTDVTERVESRRRIEESARRFQTIIDQLPAALCVRDAEGRTEIANARFREWYAQPGDTVIGKTVFDLFPHVVAADLAAVERQVLDEGLTVEKEAVQPFADGSMHTTLMSKFPIRDAEGAVVAVGTVERDFTERKRAEEALRDSEERFRTLLDTSPIGATIVRGDGTFEFVNQSLAQMLGLSRDKTLSSRARDFYVDPSERDEVNARLLAEGRLRDVEIRMKRVDGTPFWILLSFEPIPGEKGKFFGWVYDVDSLKRAEASVRAARDQATQALADLERAQADLVQAEKMASLGELTAGIAHEIKNPLNFVNNFAETSVELVDELAEVLAPLREGMDEATRDDVDDLLGTLRSDLEKIAGHGKRADSIMRKMLQHARDQGDTKVPVEVNPLVEESLKLAYHGERARHPGFNADLPTSLDPGAGTIEALSEELTRVLVNLLSNAFDAVRARATAAGDGYAPQVTVATLDRGDEVEIRIRDNGTGMPDDVQEKVFNPFFTTKPAGEGTGLGLSLSYDVVVKQHGGRMEVDSEDGQFTEFRLQLPRAARGVVGS